MTEERSAGALDERPGAADVRWWRSGDFLKRGLHMFRGDSLGLANRRGEERVVRDAVGLARQPGRGYRLDRRRLEERQLAAGQLEAVRQVRLRLIARESADVGAHDNALCEGIERGHAHASTP